MSKAFTREENEGPEVPELAPAASVLPTGSPNYITRAGADRLREELTRLVEVERPQLVDLAKSEPEVRRRLSNLDQRIFQIEQSLGNAQVVSPPSQIERVTFGATVTVREKSGDKSSYRIVGVDETDLDRGWVSWLSPIARALINGKLGQRIRCDSPAGEQELEIIAIAYE